MDQKLKIGNISLDTPVCLAPISGYSDSVFRLLVKSFGGLGLACAEMIEARSVVLGRGRKRDELLASEPEEKPLSFQLCGNDPSMMAEAAATLAETKNADIIDINMGCPDRKIMGRGAGAGFLKNLDFAASFAHAVVKAVKIPVTAKLRLGLTARDPFAAARLAPMLEAAGIAAITVHGRTADQRYSGICDKHAIRKAVESLKKIPLIGNGDIFTPEDATAMIQETGCAGVMVGRAALKKPWLLGQIADSLRGQKPEPDQKERLALLLKHFDAFSTRHGKLAALLFRRWIPQYSSSLKLERSKMIELLQIKENQILRQEFERAFAEPREAARQ